jgi:Dolichyl-phosphate-mannose-protein mannosyltransferase
VTDHNEGPLPVRAFPLLRVAGGGAALLLIAGLLYCASIDLRCARDSLAYPFGLDYGEGIVWQQALMIPGPRMYGPIDHMPFIVFHYPPVYHLVSRAVMTLGVDPLAAGRAVSIAATAVIMASIAWLVVYGLAGRVGRSAQLVGGVTGALLPLTFTPVQLWFVLMRIDMLAIALAFLGIALTVRATRHPEWLALAVPAFVLSVYTKQTELAAPVAALAVLLTMKPRAAILAILGCAVLGLCALAWLEWRTAGGFLRHIVSYNINSWSFKQLALQLRRETLYALLLLVAVAGLAALWPRRVALFQLPDVGASGTWPAVVPIVSLWLLISLAMLWSLGKTGSNVNYFIEAMCICAVPAGMVVGLCWQTVIGAPGRSKMALRFGLVGLTLGLAAESLKRRPFCPTDYVSAGLVAIQESLVQEIAKQDRPVASEDMVLLLRGGQEVPIELAIFHELSQTGQWDQRRILDLIDVHAFAFVITTPDKLYTAQRYTPEMLAAIARAYPRVETHGPYVVQYPEGP